MNPKPTADAHFLNVYCAVIEDQIHAALASLSVIDSLDPPHSDLEALFWNLDHFINRAAMVSKMLWPSSQGTFAQQRGTILREALLVANDSTLNARVLRNHLEHFDERIDEWYEKSGFRIYADRIVGPREMMIFPGKPDHSIFRHYSPNDGIYSFHGDEVNVQLMGAELQRIVCEATRFNRVVKLGKNWDVTFDVIP